jgi:hypothetical protein
LEENGFSPAGYFILPQDSWIENYYKPMEGRFDDFLKKHDNSEIAKKIVDNEREKIRKYKKYKDCSWFYLFIIHDFALYKYLKGLFFVNHSFSFQ